MAEWLKATDCKSVHESVRWFESTSAQTFIDSIPERNKNHALVTQRLCRKKD